MLPNLVYSSIATWPVVYLQETLSGEPALKLPKSLILYALPPVLVVATFGDCEEDACWPGYLGAPNGY